MPKINPEKLNKVKNLYLKHANIFPKLLVDAEKNVDSLSEDDFIGSNYSCRADKHMFVHYDFFPMVAQAAINLAPKMLLGGKSYRNLICLILKEYLEWGTGFNRKNNLRELINLQQRLNLFHDLFVAANNPLELNKKESETLTEIYNQLVDYLLYSKHKLDTFDAKELITAPHQALNAQVDCMYNEIPNTDNDKYLSRLESNIKKQMGLLNDQMSNLNMIFISLQGQGWLLNRSEQKRHELHVQLKLLTQQSEAVKNAIGDLICYAEIKQTFKDLPKLIAIEKSIESLIKNEISTCVDLMLWHVATEEGRLHDLNKLTKTISSDFDIHVLQNQLTSDLKKQVDEWFNPSGVKPDISDLKM